MNFTGNGDVRLHWRENGAGRPLLLLNSVGCDLSMWNAALPHLAGLRVLRMDMRGHGLSDVPPGDYSLEQLAEDAVSVLDAAGVAEAAVCGLSLGGMVAMTMALTHPRRVSALLPACTSARMDRGIWEARIASVRAHGMAEIADAVMARFFSPEFTEDHPEKVEAVRTRFIAMDPQGYCGCCAAIRDMDLLSRISAIAKPTRVIAGEKDMATPFDGHGGAIRDHIAGAEVRMLPAAHIAPVEVPQPFAAAVTEFLRPSSPQKP